MPEKLSLKMKTEGLIALFAHQYGPCRVTQCRVPSKDISAHLFAAICPSLSTYTHSVLCTHMCSSPGTLRSFPCRGNKPFSKGLLLRCAAQTPWNAFQRESSPLWISVACGGKMPCQTAQAVQGALTLPAIPACSLLSQTLHRCLASQN